MSILEKSYKLIKNFSNTFVLEIGWHARVSPTDHPVSQYEFDVLIGADGKRNTLLGNNFRWNKIVVLFLRDYYYYYYFDKTLVVNILLLLLFRVPPKF